MKNFLIILAALCFTITLSAKEQKAINVPEKVKAAMTKLYPDAKQVKWSKEEKNYEAEFTNKGVKTSIDIDNSGNILETETTIKLSELPKGVEEYIAKNYKGYKITETAKTVNSKGEIKYEAEISKGGKSKDLMFDKDGKLLKK